MEHSVSQNTLCSTLIAAQVEQRRAGRRQLVMHGGALCSTCLTAPPRAGQRTCRPCHAQGERERRKNIKTLKETNHGTR